LGGSTFLGGFLTTSGFLTFSGSFFFTTSGFLSSFICFFSVFFFGDLTRRLQLKNLNQSQQVL